MTPAKPLHTTHGIDLFERPDGTVTAFRGPTLAGTVWASQTRPGDWWARIGGVTAVLHRSRHAALASIVGGCPDCTCVPVLCEADDTGDSCLDCAYCLNGCSADDPCPTSEDPT